jgi:hypothetical protein
MIDDLPYLEELEGYSKMNGVPPAEMKQVSKFIRDTTYNPPMESGMYLSHHQSPKYQMQNQSQQPQQQQPPIERFEQNKNSIIEMPPDMMLQPPHHNSHHPMHQILSLSCVDVADHATNCIVCSKLYNTDTTLYIIVISILLLTIVILIKKVLDLQK